MERYHEIRKQITGQLGLLAALTGASGALLAQPPEGRDGQSA